VKSFLAVLIFLLIGGALYDHGEQPLGIFLIVSAALMIQHGAQRK
jgi:hypothetical protein